MRHITDRLKGIWKDRGPLGFLRFLMTRLVRTDRDVVFERTLAPDTADAVPGAGAGTLTTIDHANLNTPRAQDLVCRVLTDENRHYADGLAKKDMMFVVTADTDDAVLHYSCIQFESRYKKVLGEDRTVPLFTHCWTAPEARGHRLYPTVLMHGCHALAAMGQVRAIITCHPANIASVKGIEHAGFVRAREVTSLLFLSRLAVQHIREAGDKTRFRLTFL